MTVKKLHLNYFNLLLEAKNKEFGKALNTRIFLNTTRKLQLL